MQRDKPKHPPPFGSSAREVLAQWKQSSTFPFFPQSPQHPPPKKGPFRGHTQKQALTRPKKIQKIGGSFGVISTNLRTNKTGQGSNCLRGQKKPKLGIRYYGPKQHTHPNREILEAVHYIQIRIPKKIKLLWFKTNLRGSHVCGEYKGFPNRGPSRLLFKPRGGQAGTHPPRVGVGPGVRNLKIPPSARAWFPPELPRPRMWGVGRGRSTYPPLGEPTATRRARNCKNR